MPFSLELSQNDNYNRLLCNKERLMLGEAVINLLAKMHFPGLPRIYTDSSGKYFVQDSEGYYNFNYDWDGPPQRSVAPFDLYNAGQMLAQFHELTRELAFKTESDTNSDGLAREIDEQERKLWLYSKIVENRVNPGALDDMFQVWHSFIKNKVSKAVQISKNLEPPSTFWICSGGLKKPGIVFSKDCRPLMTRYDRCYTGSRVRDLADAISWVGRKSFWSSAYVYKFIAGYCSSTQIDMTERAWTICLLQSPDDVMYELQQYFDEGRDADIVNAAERFEYALRIERRRSNIIEGLEGLWERRWS